ncbi:NADP-specific glutamate dehydrogenase [Fulvivirga sp. M361]|uniref:NADP-specific glutamate dehydrogenase n=1 Tax=Fulvivirga sp. M361 TaxID=2594266 RepID=UPI00117AA4A8|nr:NADP-specific glutamate dehydrogenase [Fulvivirga sp. M361]TRX58403.1 NADP-specific glutamate dehydrogenase [Fulvivirga sp. M361]
MSEILEIVKNQSPGEPEFHQAVEEVVESVKPVLDKHPKYRNHKILERMVEPERLISFRVAWLDDNQEIQVNRGYRVQMNSALGPYKGGIRFHPSVYGGVLKFLAFEQTFKNALTGLPMGGGKGGSDFNPKGRSDTEVMRFCQSFMAELARHIGNRTDIPAGDIGVGGREIGFMFGAQKKISNQFAGVLTGKGVGWGGSMMRTEATGYGLVYFAQNMLAVKKNSLKDKVCIVSGSGNVAQHAVEKIIDLGGKPITISDSSGFIHDEQGIDADKLSFIKDLKNNRRGRIKEYADKYSSASYTETKNGDTENGLWHIKADCAFPCATQNELGKKDAEKLVGNGIKLIGEGANMPLTAEAAEIVIKSGILYSPGKASNAGGVATSGIEMMQNYMGSYWSAKEVDERLKKIMSEIHQNCLDAAEAYGFKDNYVAGANIAGFIKVADAMIAQGVV